MSLPALERAGWALVALAIVVIALTVPGPRHPVVRVTPRALLTTSTLTDRLSSDHASVEITGLPAGTVRIHVAHMPKLAAAGSEVHYGDYPTSKVKLTPGVDWAAADKVVDAIAESSTGASLGTWAGRLETSLAPPPPPPPSLKVGLDTGGWWLTNDTAVMAGKKLILRSQNLAISQIAAYEAHGFPVIDLVGHNPATSINGEALASEAVARAQAHPAIAATEILNEPQNPYLGGSESQANIEAYARVVNTVADRFVAAYTGKPGAIPRLLWSCDGGFRGVPSWGAKVWPLLDTNARTYGRPTAHPYGGTGERAKSALGNRGRVEECFRLTGEKGWVTEVGWPTATGQPSTGDSLQWTEAEQARNIESFLLWAPADAEEVTVFQYRDYATNNWYGVESHEGRHKPAYTVLQTLAP